MEDGWSPEVGGAYDGIIFCLTGTVELDEGEGNKGWGETLLL
jgi:hypothetical protein